MVNSYQTSLPYSQPVANIPANQQQVQYQPVEQLNYEQIQQKQPSSLGVGLKTGLIGGAVGALVSLKNNPIIDKAGEVSSEYAVKIYEKTLAGKEKKAYEEGLELLKKIDGAKSADDLKALLNSNQEVANELAKDLGKDPDKFVKNISRWNLRRNKKAIKNKLEASNNLRIQDIKNQIQACWDPNTKKFAKADTVTDVVYESIKNVKNTAKAKAAGRKALIVGGISAVAGFVLHKVLTLKAQAAAQQNY